VTPDPSRKKIRRRKLQTGFRRPSVSGLHAGRSRHKSPNLMNNRFVTGDLRDVLSPRNPQSQRNPPEQIRFAVINRGEVPLSAPCVRSCDLRTPDRLDLRSRRRSRDSSSSRLLELEKLIGPPAVGERDHARRRRLSPTILGASAISERNGTEGLDLDRGRCPTVARRSPGVGVRKPPQRRECRGGNA